MWARDHTFPEARAEWSCQGLPGLVPGREDKGHQGTWAARQDGPTSGPSARGVGVSGPQDKAVAARTAPPRGLRSPPPHAPGVQARERGHRARTTVRNGGWRRRRSKGGKKAQPRVPRAWVHGCFPGLPSPLLWPPSTWGKPQ